MWSAGVRACGEERSASTGRAPLSPKTALAAFGNPPTNGDTYETRVGVRSFVRSNANAARVFVVAFARPSQMHVVYRNTLKSLKLNISHRELPGQTQKGWKCADVRGSRRSGGVGTLSLAVTDYVIRPLEPLATTLPIFETAFGWGKGFEWHGKSTSNRVGIPLEPRDPGGEGGRPRRTGPATCGGA